jgi:hypothetical protein
LPTSPAAGWVEGRIRSVGCATPVAHAAGAPAAGSLARHTCAHLATPGDVAEAQDFWTVEVERVGLTDCSARGDRWSEEVGAWSARAWFAEPEQVRVTGRSC